MTDREAFLSALSVASSALNLDIDESAAEKLAIYYTRTVEWNEKINLTAITSAADFAVKNVIDSLAAWDDALFEESGERFRNSDISPLTEKTKSPLTLIDVGTGAGLPGIPFAIWRPKCEYTLLDSLNKRLNVVSTIAAEIWPKEEINKPRLTFLHARAEEIGHAAAYRENRQIAVARAVAKSDILAEYLLPLVKVGGFAVFLKGPDGETELKEAKEKIAVLGGEIVKVKNFSLPTAEREKRTIIYIRKVRPTSGKYPRSPAEIKRKIRRQKEKLSVT